MCKPNCCLLPGEHVDKPLQRSNKLAGVWQAVVVGGSGGKWKNGIPTRTSKSVGNVAVTVVAAVVAAVVAS